MDSPASQQAIAATGKGADLDQQSGSSRALGADRQWAGSTRDDALYASLREQVAGQQEVILEQKARLTAAESARDKAHEQVRELEARLELFRAELNRSRGQLEFVRDLMLQQVRL